MSKKARESAAALEDIKNAMRDIKMAMRGHSYWTMTLKFNGNHGVSCEITWPSSERYGYGNTEAEAMCNAALRVNDK